MVEPQKRLQAMPLRAHDADLKERQKQPAGAAGNSSAINGLPLGPENIHDREIGLGSGPHEH